MAVIFRFTAILSVYYQVEVRRGCATVRNCLVCNKDLQGSSLRCQNCHWPSRFADQEFRDPSLKKATLDWAIQIYREFINLRQDLGDRAEVPVRNINNLTLTETDQDRDELRSDLTKLNNGMKIISDEQNSHTQKISQLFNRLGEVEKLLQSQQVSTANINTFIGQQVAENQRISSQNQSDLQVLETHDRLIKEHHQKIGQIDSIKSILLNRRVNQSVVADSGNNSSSSVVATNNVGMSFSSEEIDLIGEYNNSPQEIPNSLREQMISVSIDPEAFVRLRDGNDSNITFNKDRKGNYLVVSKGGYSYLIPNKQRRIIAQIYITTKAIYNCEGYSESYQNFQLIKPALVSEDAIDCWRLNQKGILEFI
jgi:hypothetical protein